LTGKVILDATEIGRALRRIAHEIIESAESVSELVFVGIRKGGAPLADRLAGEIKKGEEGGAIPVGYLDVTFYRDDVGLRETQPVALDTEIEFDIGEKVVVLVDDVIHSGRTIRAALDALVALGRPKAIRLAVLIDRGHREYPIQPDFVGRHVPTSRDETITVHFLEVDGVDEVRVSRTPWRNHDGEKSV
jgi:pyrimidine operon attenuation protein/uracil phosphoribosyltransferase